MTIRYHSTAERPALNLWIFDNKGDLIDFSTGYSFVFEAVAFGEVALSKTAGIVGAAGAGVEPTGTPNIVIEWAAGELDLPVACYQWFLTATTGGLDRVYQGEIEIRRKPTSTP